MNHRQPTDEQTREPTQALTLEDIERQLATQNRDLAAVYAAVTREAPLTAWVVPTPALERLRELCGPGSSTSGTGPSTPAGGIRC